MVSVPAELREIDERARYHKRQAARHRRAAVRDLDELRQRCQELGFTFEEVRNYGRAEVRQSQQQQRE